MKSIAKSIAAIVLAAVILITTAMPVMAGDIPYQGFVHDSWGITVPTPAAYIPTRSVGALDIDASLGNWVEPSDIRVDINNNIYLLDTGNNRIVVFDAELNLIRVIDGFVRDGVWETFYAPAGMFINADLELFIADTNNRRVVMLDQYGGFIRTLENIVIDEIEDTFDFLPQQVLEDRGGRIYVIVRNVFEGIMGFTPEGEFLGYFGSVAVHANPLDVLWRMFMTQEQRARQRLFLPTEFISMDIDEYGFIFATRRVQTRDDDAVMRLNPKGDNVIRNHTDLAIAGSLSFRTSGPFWGPSVFTDIVARPYGMFSALDSTRGRVYTYDSEGHLLYVISGVGNILGMSRRPSAIEMLGDSILVLDQQRGQIIYFEPTHYGTLINEASRLRYLDDEAGAVEKWREIAELNDHFALAQIGIGRSLLAAGDNASAMDYLRRGRDTHHYSIAFRRHRSDMMQAAANYVFTGGLVLVGVMIVSKIYKRVKTREAEVLS